MNYKLINRDSNFTKGWELYKDGTLIASTFKTDLPSITFSDEAAKELGIIDVEKLAKNNAKDTGDLFSISIQQHSYELGHEHGFIEGYNQATSSSKDKLFTLKEMYEKIAFWFGRGVLAGKENRVSELMPNREKIIQSLSRQEYECFGELQGNIFLVTKIIK